MLLFFHDIGMPPLWVLGLWLIAFLAFPFFFIKGLYSLVRQRLNSTFMYTFSVLFLIALTYHILWIFIYKDIEFFAFMTFPFGAGAVPIFMMFGLPTFFLILFGIMVNFVSIYGFVGIVERMIAKREK